MVSWAHVNLAKAKKKLAALEKNMKEQKQKDVRKIIEEMDYEEWCALQGCMMNKMKLKVPPRSKR